MFANSVVEWPSLGYWPGFKSLATDPENEFMPPYQTIGDVTLPGGSTIPFPIALDLSGTTSIAGYDVPTVALVGLAAVLAVSLLAPKAKRAYRAKRATSSKRSARIAQLKAELAAAQS